MASNTGTAVIKIVSIDMDAEIEGQNGTYHGVEVVYKNSKGETKTKAIHEKAFKFNKDLQADLDQLEKGDYAEVEWKKEGDFVNWVSATKTEKPEEREPAREASSRSERPTGKTGEYNDPRETKDERAARQVMIVRQSSISNALTFYALEKGEYKPTVTDVLGVAKQFEDFVFGRAPTVAEEPKKETPAKAKAAPARKATPKADDDDDGLPD